MKEAIKLPPGMPLNPAPSQRRSMADVTREEWARAQKIREQEAAIEVKVGETASPSGKIIFPKQWSY